MKSLKGLFLLLFITTFSFAQNANRTFKKAQDKGAYLEVVVNDGTYRIQFYTTEIIETSFIPKGELFNPKSHAVVLSPERVRSTMMETSNSIVYKTEGIQLKIQKSPFKISYEYRGKEVISEKEGYSKIATGEAIQFNIDAEETLYGGGARALGMNRRGNRLELYNKAHYGYETHSELMNYTLPIVMSSNMYMIHFDNTPVGFLDLDSKRKNILTYETISGRKTYQVIVGDSWLDLIKNYTDLTGKQPLPPRWAFGNFASRFGYHSQSETERTVKAFKDEKIPLDAVIIDIYWFGKTIKGTMGNLEFLKDSFPNPKKMIKDFKDKGIRTILVTEPFILTTSNRWEEAVDKEILAKNSIGNPYTFDFYFGNTGLIDIYNPKGKKWFWNIYKDLADIGISGVWGDLGEPEVHPEKLLHANGTANEVHNIYGHDWARLVYEGYKNNFPEQRPFILMRAGAAGSQRFGLIPWSGDVNRSWGGLQSQPEIALQMGMQGLGYMHSDLGGFAGANLDDELYTRWLQYGVFQPIYRPHAQEEVPSEPVFREPKTKALAKQSIELRYRLLPYNYTIAFENNQTGAPLMRPLFFEDSENKELQKTSTTFLWGNDFLIAPILKPSVKEKEVYFPKNTYWFDFYTGEEFVGGKSKIVKTKENSIPTFVRAGAFIPTAKPMQTTKEYSGNDFSLHYYHHESIQKSNGQLYNDDGITANAFERGMFEILSFESELKKHYLELEFKSETGTNYISKNKQIDVVIHHINQKPRSIKFGRKKVEFVWNEVKRTLTTSVNWDTKKRKKLIIKF